jgi:HemY protein
VLWSLLKIFAFLAIAAALAFTASWILETPGEVKIAFGGREFFVSPIGFVIGLVALIFVALVILRIIGFLVALVRFLLGDETALSRYFLRNRERRGFDAFSDGMVALASGDSRMAMKKAQKAEKLLNRPDLTQLLTAQAAEMSGDRPKTFDSYKAMLANDRTRPLALQGLTRLKLDEGDTETALALARKAFALRPDNERVLRTLFDLQSKQEDWAGARETLNASMHARLLPRDVGTRRDAVLSLADARGALAEGNATRGNEAALQANRLAPTLIPAAALAARVQAEKGSKRKATRILTTAWAANPHPELAAAFAALEPGETPAARRKRFETLTAAAPGHPESRLLDAELALAAEDFPAARKALGDLAESQPTTRSLALMAAIERGQGAPDAVVRGWLAKALGASRGPQWVCGKCTHIHAGWAPVCENCGAFDTLDWTTPTHAGDAGLADSALLPLIVGAGGGVEPEPEPEPEPRMPPRPDVEDAELAAGASSTRL